MSILIGLIAAVTPIAPVAMTADDRATTVVASRDLDLTRSGDRRRLNRRLQTAVTRVCLINGRSLEELAWRDACRAEASALAQPQAEAVVAAAQAGRPTQLTAR